MLLSVCLHLSEIASACTVWEREHCPQACCPGYAFTVKMCLSVMRLHLSSVCMQGDLPCDPWKTQQGWRNDAASDCLAAPVLFRKYQSPPTQSPRSSIDANVPPVACRIWGMLFESLSLYTGRLMVSTSNPPPPSHPRVPQEFRCIVTERHALPMTVTHRVAIASQLCSRPRSRNWGDVNTFYFIHLVYWLLHAAKRPSDFICNRAGHQSLWRQKEVGTTGVYSYKSDSSLSEQLGNKYIDMICVWVSVRVITGLKQWALLAFKVTRAVVWVL